MKIYEWVNEGNLEDILFEYIERLKIIELKKQRNRESLK